MTITAILSSADGADTAVDLNDWQRRGIGHDELLCVDAESSDPEELNSIQAALQLADESAAMFNATPSKPSATVHDDSVEVVVLALGDDLDADPVPLQVLIGEGLGHHAPR